MVGLQAILVAYGGQGWELVSLVPEYSRVYRSFWFRVTEPDAFRVTFKRPVEG